MRAPNALGLNFDDRRGHVAMTKERIYMLAVRLDTPFWRDFNAVSFGSDLIPPGDTTLREAAEEAMGLARKDHSATP